MPDGGASIWLPMLIGGATATATTAIGAHAAGEAADTQVAYGQKALDLEKAMYGDAVKRTQPYINAGTSAENALMKLMGLGTGGPLGGTANPTQPDAAMPPGFQGEAPVMDVRNVEMDQAASPAAAWDPLAAVMGTANPAQAKAAAGPFGAPTANQPPAGAGTMVMMLSPDGKPQAVPKDQVPFYQRRGATIAPGSAAA